jgi:aspartate racemase
VKNAPASCEHRRQKQVIGIVGGLGPYAHIDLERKLLRAAYEIVGAHADQSFPEWIVSSAPQTPDRTQAIEGRAPDPTPWLVASVKRLERGRSGRLARGADFAIIPCITSHAFFGELRHRTSIDILDMIDETASYITRLHPRSKVGVLATTGTLKRRLFHDKLKRHGHAPLSLFDVPDGEELQRRYVMEAIYGPWRAGRFGCGGIKSCGPRPEHARLLRKAAKILVDALHVDVIVAGCTEIPLALTKPKILGVPLIDPVGVLACAAVRRAYGIGR